MRLTYLRTQDSFELKEMETAVDRQTSLDFIQPSLNGDIIRVNRSVRPYFYQVKNTNSGQLVHALDSLQFIVNKYYSRENFSDVSFIDNALYFSTQEGLFVHDLHGTRRGIMPGRSVSSSLIDDEGYLWVSTTNNGVYVMSRNESVTVFPINEITQGEKILNIAALDGALFCGTNKGNVMALEYGKSIIQTKNEHDIHYLKKFNGSLYASSGITITPKLEVNQNVLQQENYISLPIHDSMWFITKSNSYGFAYNGFICEDINIGRVLDVQFLTPSTLLIASFGNLFTKDVNTGQEKSWYKGDATSPPLVREICMHDRLIVLATLGAGLQVCTRDGEVLATMNTTNGMPSNMVNAVEIDPQARRIWCCTNKGLSIINYELNGTAFTIESIRNLSQVYGLPSNYLVDLALTDDYAWIASGKEVCRIPRNHVFHETASPMVVLEDFFSNGQSVDNMEKVFSYNQNDIHITYCGISLRQPVSESFYKYRLLSSGKDTTWKYTNERGVSFVNLQHGIYQFEVSARVENGSWSEATIIPFEIEPFVLNRWEARWVMIALLAALIYFIVRRRYQKILETHKSELAFNDMNMRVNQLELDSLRGQMNPHFIFNALKSIQRNILVEDKSKANKLLTRFSKLIRSSLEFSRKDFVPLNEEIEFLRNYLEIEMERMPDRFTYQMSYDKDEISDLLIPPLLLQPICENAIKHAFVDESGTINITITRTADDFLCIDIVDDGIGIHKAPNKTKAHGNSVGLEIVQSRLNLLNEQGYPCEMQVTVANTETNRGTKVAFKIPHL